MSQTSRTDDDSEENWAVNRRKYLSALSVAAGVGLAGCGGDGGGNQAGGDENGSDGGESDGGGSDGGTEGSDGGDLGERVPTVKFEVITGIGDSTQVIEDSTAIITDNVNEHLGVETEIIPKDIGTIYSEVYNDSRNHHLHMDTKTLDPVRLDPNQMLVNASIINAGADGGPSLTQYANCEYSQLVRQQAQAADPDERRELVHEALGIASADVERINLFNRTAYGAYRTDLLNIEDMGEAKIIDSNHQLIKEAEPDGADAKVANQRRTTLRSENHLRLNDGPAYALWSNLIYAPLIQVSKNWELHPGLATDWEVTNNFQTITFTLRDGITFHNGDPITAEDVKWTHEYLETNANEASEVFQWPYDSIEAVDDSTVEMNFTEPVPPYLYTHAAKHGILPSELWIDQGAEENPSEFTPDSIVGSGPYQVTDFRQHQLLQTEPYEDYWDPANGDFVIQVFQDTQSEFRAFQEGSLNIFFGVPSSIANEIRDNMTDTAELTVTNGYTEWWLTPYTNFGPTKFREFRMAVSQALDRQAMNQSAKYGDATTSLYSCILGQSHPYYPEDAEGLTQIAESVRSNPEAAQQALEEAGWGWDDQGRLHYPPDADLEPLWPQGETPGDYPDKFPCVDELS